MRPASRLLNVRTDCPPPAIHPSLCIRGVLGSGSLPPTHSINRAHVRDTSTTPKSHYRDPKLELGGYRTRTREKASGPSAKERGAGADGTRVFSTADGGGDVMHEGISNVDDAFKGTGTTPLPATLLLFSSLIYTACAPDARAAGTIRRARREGPSRVVLTYRRSMCRGDGDTRMLS